MIVTVKSFLKDDVIIICRRMSKLSLQPGISKISVMYRAQEHKEELVGCC